MIEIKFDALWSAVRDGLRQDVPAALLDLWLSGVRLAEDKPGSAIIEVADIIHQGFVKEHLAEPIRNRLSRCTGIEWKTEIRINPEVGKLQQGELFPEAEMTPEPEPEPVSLKKGKATTTKITVGTLKDEHQFSNYVVGPSNAMAVAAAKRVADLPAGDKGVILIYGGTGLGKTHLLHAIGRECSENNPKAKIALVRMIDWINEFIESLQKNGFREKYRNIDLFLIDDVQVLGGKERSMEEFFDMFNWLLDRGKKMVFTSDKVPQDIPGLEERLVSRFTWGITAFLSPPDFEMRVAILKMGREKLPAALRPVLTDAILEHVAERVTRNVRRLESTVLQMSVWASLNTRRLLTTEILEREVLRDIYAVESKESVSPEKIMRVVSTFMKVKEQELRGPKRTASIAWARQMAMYLCRKETNLTLQEISHIFGKKDHGTVMHAVDKVNDALELDPKVVDLLRVLMRELQA
jgi:chromosomal replication initiator protein